MSESPIRFATIARRLSVPVDLVDHWATLPGFPSAGVGVAVFSDVERFVAEIGSAGVDGADVVEAGEVSVEAVAAVVPLPADDVDVVCVAADADAAGGDNGACLESGDGVEWVDVTVRIPVIDSGSSYVPQRLQMWLSADDVDVRRVLSRIAAGCRASGRQLPKVGDAMKLILRQIADQIGV